MLTILVRHDRDNVLVRELSIRQIARGSTPPLPACNAALAAGHSAVEPTLGISQKRHGHPLGICPVELLMNVWIKVLHLGAPVGSASRLRVAGVSKCR